MEDKNRKDEIKKRINGIMINRFNFDLTKIEQAFDTGDLFGAPYYFTAKELMYLFFEIEKEFKIKIPESEVINKQFNLLPNISDIISKQLNPGI